MEWRYDIEGIPWRGGDDCAVIYVNSGYGTSVILGGREPGGVVCDHTYSFPESAVIAWFMAPAAPAHEGMPVFMREVEDGYNDEEAFPKAGSCVSCGSQRHTIEKSEELVLVKCCACNWVCGGHNEFIAVTRWNDKSPVP